MFASLFPQARQQAQRQAEERRAAEMREKAAALRESGLGTFNAMEAALGIGVRSGGLGVDPTKRLRGRAGVAKARVSADAQLAELQKTRRRLRRTRQKWANTALDMEQARRTGESESSTLIYNLKRDAALQALQEEQLRKLAELTAVHEPALTVGAIEAVESSDAPAASALVQRGVGSAEEGRLSRIAARRVAEAQEEARAVAADKWMGRIKSAAAGVPEEQLAYAAAQKREQATKLLAMVKSQLGTALQHSQSASSTVEGAFQRFDSDGGGSLDYAEFHQALESLYVAPASPTPCPAHSLRTYPARVSVLGWLSALIRCAQRCDGDGSRSRADVRAAGQGRRR